MQDIRLSPAMWNIVSVSLGAVVIWSLAFVAGRYSSSTRRRARIMRREREAELKILIADAVTEAVEDLVFTSKIKRSEASFWYNRLGHVLTLPDILQKNTATLKEQLQAKHPNHKKNMSNVIPLHERKLGSILKR
jgi:hypothetical protein